MDYEGDVDFFCFISEPEIYLDNIKVAYGTLSKVDVTLYDSEGTGPPEVNRSHGRSIVTIAHRMPSPTGHYYAAVHSREYDTGTYTLTAEYCRTAGQNCPPLPQLKG